MKTTGILLIALSIITYKSNAQATLTTTERDYAIRSLAETEAGVFASVKDLSEAQLKFKASADKWSVEECVKHIATAEKALWAMVEESLKKPANPDKRAEIKFTDADLVKAVEDRSHRSKTFAALEPANSNYDSAAEALANFKQNRDKLIAFVKNTQDDLRNHVSVLPIGTYDAYQFILLISAHSNRHTQQIDGVKANARFPKK
ncbi:DinB family protein [Mucilaginibacter conchicola]|uniref:DinB family protein n=1 Tax=Mucilaginibacter conchicola TaxID=2303333 RepID=A0A372NT87_9SPHI|nr:DinB family protein [Mucilaginibacter conchicola]RFZ92490.1 DinB family protein [Mucilaginibacter conchicola]